MTSKTTRTAKLHSRFRDGAQRKEVPWLNLSGQWLEELGFNIGDPINITVREKLLIIEVSTGTVQEEAAEYKAAIQQVKQTLKKLL